MQIATGLAQFTLSFVVLIFGLRSARPVMSSGNYFSAGAILFYVLVILVFVSTGISIWFSLRRKREQTPIPAQLIEANKAKIAQVFHAHGEHASENIQKVAHELYEQLSRSESEEKHAIVKIAKRSLSTRLTLTYQILSQALAEGKDSFPVLQRYLEDFFLIYFDLVVCVLDLEEKFIERDGLPGRTYIVWHEHHGLFLNDLRELFAEEDFSSSRKRIEESRRALED